MPKYVCGSDKLDVIQMYYKKGTLNKIRHIHPSLFHYWNISLFHYSKVIKNGCFNVKKENVI